MPSCWTCGSRTRESQYARLKRTMVDKHICPDCRSHVPYGYPLTRARKRALGLANSVALLVILQSVVGVNDFGSNMIICGKIIGWTGVCWYSFGLLINGAMAIARYYGAYLEPR